MLVSFNLLTQGSFVKKLLLVLAVSTWSLNAHADNNQSIMFDEPVPEFIKHSDSTAAATHAEKCKALNKKINDLKGKPQRRFTALERYKLECQGK